MGSSSDLLLPVSSTLDGHYPAGRSWHVSISPDWLSSSSFHGLFFSLTWSAHHLDPKKVETGSLLYSGPRSRTKRKRNPERGLTHDDVDRWLRAPHSGEIDWLESRTTTTTITKSSTTTRGCQRDDRVSWWLTSASGKTLQRLMARETCPSIVTD